MTSGQSILVGRGAAQSRVGDVLNASRYGCCLMQGWASVAGTTALRDRLARLARLAQDPFAGENKGS
jgi:hypothetical protein